MTSDGGPTFGTLRQDEADSFLAVMCASFGIEFAAAKPIFDSDPYFELKNKYVVRVGDRIVSCLTIVDRMCWVGNCLVHAAGIAGVATIPEYRQRGLAGQLITETVQSLSARGFHVALLFAADQEYYRKYGWGVAGLQFTARGFREDSSANSDGVTFRSLQNGDIESLASIYNRASAQRTMYCTRDADRWAYLLTYLPQSVGAVSPKEEVLGYALCDIPGAKQEQTSSLPPVGRIHEVHATNAATRGEICAYLRRHQVFSSADCSSTHDQLTLNRFAYPYVQRPGPMARILDWQSVLSTLAPSWEGMQGSVGISITDPITLEGPGTAVIGTRSGTPFVERAAPNDLLSRTPDVLVGDVAAWSAVVVGHISGGEACRSGLLKASTSAAARIAEQLFPYREPFIPTADHF